MFLHLGGDVAVNQNHIIAIFDLDNTTTSKITREFLKKATDDNSVININSEELPKSFVVTIERGVKKLYVSPISSRTLLKRSSSSGFLK